MLSRLILICGLLVLVHMTGWFIMARSRRRLDTVDAAWGGGFALVAWVTYTQQQSLRCLLIALLVTIWSVRLTLHIAKRSRKHGEDPRYIEMSKKWQGNVWVRAYFSIFLLQGLLILLVSLPIIMNANVQLVGLQWLTYLGVIVWLGGFVFETVADKQLAQFLAAGNKGKLLSSGLWRYSRHPNYFGEVTQWFGIGLIACQVSFGWLGLLGPALLTVLIVFVSGIPPIEMRRAGDAAYQDYKRRTSPLVPLPPKA